MRPQLIWIYSWLLIFVLLTWMLGRSYYLAGFKTWSPLLSG
jgi:hypothetical protein